MSIYLHLRKSRAIPIALTFTLSAGTNLIFAGTAMAAHNEPAKISKAAPAAAPAQAAEAPPELTPVTLLALVRSAKILDPDYPVHVRLVNREATLTTMRHPKATEQDCKIDAVLVAKAVMDAYPKDVARIKLVLNTSNSDTIQEVTVTTGDIKAYATGTISKDDLLTSLELKKFEPSANDQESLSATEGSSRPVAAGPFGSQRQLLAGRIEKLKARGTGTQPFEAMLAKIEADAQKPSTDMPKATLLQEIRGLDAHLYEQEEALRAAQHPGVINTVDSKNQRYFQGQPGQERGRPAEGQGGGRRQGGFWMASARITGKMREMQKHGTNVSSYQQQLNHIQELFLSGDKAGAESQLQSLSNQLGINSNGGR